MLKKIILSDRQLGFIEKLIVSTVSIILLSVPYFIIGKIKHNRLSSEILLTQYDLKIPLIPLTIWYYLGGLYLSILLIVFLLKDRKNFYHSIFTSISTAFFCFSVFYFFPVPYPRPIFQSFGKLSSTQNHDIMYLFFDKINLKMLNQIYLLDENINTFPSLHVAYCFIFFLGLIPEYSKLSLLFALNFVLIYITTLTTKQHFIVDGIAGIVVSLFFYFLCKKIIYSKK